MTPTAHSSAWHPAPVTWQSTGPHPDPMNRYAKAKKPLSAGEAMATQRHVPLATAFPRHNRIE